MLNLLLAGCRPNQNLPILSNVMLRAVSNKQDINKRGMKQNTLKKSFERSTA